MIKEKKDFGMSDVIVNWKKLESAGQIEDLRQVSNDKPVVVFKHSTRCSISGMVLSRLQREWNEEEMEGIEFYFLDLLSNRDISSKVAEKFGVEHQSPQLIIIKDGEAVYNTSHMGVSYHEMKKHLK